MGDTVKTCASCGSELPHDAGACPSCGAELGSPPQPAKRAGMPLWARVGCLGALVLLGLIVAALIPSSLNAPRRARQRAQISQVRSFATAVLAYETDFKKAPLPKGSAPEGGWHFVPLQEIAPALVPGYVKEITDSDPYGRPYLYGFKGDDPAAFCIIGTGSDGRRDTGEIPTAPVQTHCWESDIIWVNDAFVQLPAGPQHRCGKSAASHRP